ncbi:hypothetical protein A8C56_08240 [Niabella ginsenosidivorans]|uniref:Uncharacterized protein n=1 Tax=Niabella ginsenosidivorans TaxID=1176587 RepID=A0A1A9I2P4_9BACT|nr:hypothetical protein A8C56_08240 [Niabella ginsenosidivorans]
MYSTGSLERSSFTGTVNFFKTSLPACSTELHELILDQKRKEQREDSLKYPNRQEKITNNC